MKASKGGALFEKREQYYIFVLMAIYMTVLALFAFFCREHLISAPDTVSYTVPAHSLLNLQGFIDKGFPVGFRTPGYPLFLALVFLFKDNLYAVVGVQILISTLCMYAVYKTCLLSNLKTKTALVCSIFYACELGIWIYSSFVLTDAFFMHMVVFATYFLVKYCAKKRTFDFVFFILFLNYALMVRPILIYFNILVSLAVFVLYLLKKLPFKNVIISVVILTFVMGGWSIRNYYKAGVFKYSVVQDFNSFEFDGAALRQSVEGITLEEARDAFERDFNEKYPPEKIEGMRETEVYALKGQLARDYKKEHFGAYLIMNVKGLLGVLFGPNNSFITSIVQNKPAALAVIGLYEAFLCFIYGMYLLGWITNFKKTNIVDWFILMYSGYCAVASANVGYARFRVSFIGLIILGAFIIWKENNFPDKIRNVLKGLFEGKKRA